MPNLRQELEQFRSTPQAQGLLRMIRTGEGTAGPQGYQTMFGGGTFDVSKGWRHPDKVINSGGYSSAAAGAYQFLPGTWQRAQKALGLGSFDPSSQDLAALYLAKQRGAIDVLQSGGKLSDVMNKLAPEWASIPTREGKSYYGQPVKSVSELAKAYEEGKLSSPVQTPTSQAVQKGNTFGQLLVDSVVKELINRKQREQQLPQLLSPSSLLAQFGVGSMPTDFLEMFR